MIVALPGHCLYYLFIYTVYSRYLEVQGTLLNTSRYPYIDISDFQNLGNAKSNTATFHK